MDLLVKINDFYKKLNKEGIIQTMPSFGEIEGAAERIYKDNYFNDLERLIPAGIDEKVYEDLKHLLDEIKKEVEKIK